MPRSALSFLMIVWFACPALAVEPRGRWTIDDVVNSEEANGFRLAPDSRHVVWIKKVADQEKNGRVGNLFLSSTTEAKEIQLTRGGDNCTSPAWSPNGQRIAFLSTRGGGGDTQIWLIQPFGGEPWKVTGRSGGVLRFEWSNPETILFTARDPVRDKEAGRENDTTIVVDDEINEPPTRLFQLTLATGEVKRLTDNSDRIQDFALSPDGQWAVTFHERSLRYEYDNRIKPATFLYDLKRGQRKQIFQETKFNPTRARWCRDGKGFYVSSDFTTSPRFVQATISELYYFDLAAGTPVQVNLRWDKGLSAQWENDDQPGFVVTDDGFLALLADGVRSKAVRYTRQGNTWRRADLVGENADTLVGLEVSGDGRTLVYASSTAQIPVQWYRAALVGERVRPPVALTALNESFRDKPRARVEVVHWKGARNEEVEGLLYYPHEFKEGKKYPLVVLLHGGPLDADLDAWYETWSHPHQLLAGRGAFVFRPNYHGSSNYGLAWAESIAGRYLDLEPTDVDKGVDALIARGSIDPNRLGIMGMSNGGILTAEITTRTTRYQAASVMAATVEQASDWGSTRYGASFDQYYLGASPLRSPRLYLRKSAFYRLDQVRTPTLICCGTEDQVVGTQQAWCHYRALQQTGKVPTRLLLFPGEGHGLDQLTHQRRKLEEELAWFDKYLFARAQ